MPLHPSAGRLDEAAVMDQASQASPSSTAETAKFPGQKDRNCPFCGQAFTSSSLGRHLDLYIKPKNPKDSDGIHNVEEIRKMRQHITRRQARTFHHHNNNRSATRDSSTPTTTSKTASPMSTTNPPPPVPVISNLNGIPRESMGTRLNVANWQATGVINLPPRPVYTVPRPELRREMPRHQQVKIEHEQRQKLVEETEGNRAVEMALREVLGAVKAAKTKDNSLFDFNPYKLGFPGLCLRILPAPPTLFTTTPFQSNDSWTVGPPGRDQLSALHRHIQAKAQAKQQHQQHLNHTNGCLDGPTLAPPLPLEQQIQKLLNHAEETYNHWMSLSEQQQQEYWQLEILRAFAGERDACRDTQVALDEARLEISRLKAQISRLSCQRQGSVDGYQPPPLSRLPTEVLEDMATSSVTGAWDYDSLIAKWRAWVRNERSANGGMANQRRTLSGIASSAFKNLKGLAGSQRVNGCSTNIAHNRVKAEETSGSLDYRSAQAGIDTDTRECEGDDNDVDAEGEEDQHLSPLSRVPSNSSQYPPSHRPRNSQRQWCPPVTTTGH